MVIENFKKCLIAPIFVFLVVILSFSIIGTRDYHAIEQAIDLFLEPFTYCCYAFALGIIICHLQPYQTKQQKKHLVLFFILFGCAVLREMGIQHWLTSTDTTAFKIRFFTNPANPIHEKVIAGFLLLSVFSIIFYLLVYYMPKIIRGFFKLNPLYWTVVTFGCTGIICKIADRLPSNLRKAGYGLDPIWSVWMELFEETTEMCLPLLCALGFVQFARMSQIEHQKKID